MKIFIDWLKKAITKIEHDSELYVGNQFSNKFAVYFYNVGTDTDWFPTLTQLAPNGREAGPFSADSDSFTTTTIDNVTYLTVTFTMGTGYAFIKGVSSFFLYENRITTPHPTKSVIGKFIVTLNNSDNGYFIDDPEFNPKVKEYVDKYSQLRFGGEASTSVIEALDSNQGVWLATDTGYYWYWDYDNNEYVRGNLFQAVSVADNGISTPKIQDGAVTENKLASAVKNKINNSVQKGENNPTAASNVRTIISNSNSQEEDTDTSYGSHVDLSLDKATVGHSFSSGGTTKYSGIKFDEYHDNTTNEDYPRAVIETDYQDSATPENSKITVLKDLIELLTGGKITLQAKKNINITSTGDDTNQIEGDINIETQYGGITIETDTDHEITIISGGGINLRDDTYIVNSNLHVDREIYENNKRVSTKEYVLQREAYLQQQIDDIEIQTNVVKQSDIADNLNTDDATKVLSAAQGVILKGFIDSINTLLQCDDTTLDEIQEIVDYIKNNKSLIDGITTSKVNVSDIVNNLTSTATNKPLSANQGKVLKDTLDSVQASISAITTNKQDKIDSSHKLDADLVSDSTSSNKFVSAYLKSLITTNRQDINSLDGRVTNLENNPTSNVSGTNDGTNWTTITIGNETYAIPSGSSSGGSSASSGAYYEIKTSDIAFYDENGNQVTDDVVPNLKITLSEGQFEALKEKANPVLTQEGLPTLTDINSLLTLLNGAFTETSASASNKAWSLFVLSNSYCDFYIDISGSTGLPMYANALICWAFVPNIIVITNVNNIVDINGKMYNLYMSDDGADIPYGISATWTLSQYGTSGGSSSSESYYKIVLEDEANNLTTRLTTLMTTDTFNNVLLGINDQMGTNLATPTDFINFYDNVKGVSNLNAQCCLLFTNMVMMAKNDNTKVAYSLVNNGQVVSTTEILEANLMQSNIYGISGGLLNNIFNNGIDFTSSSTLTITEQTNQKI